MQVLADRTIAACVRLVQLEDRPFTLDSFCLDNMRAKILAHLKDRRSPKPAPDPQTHPAFSLATAIQGLAALGYHGLTEVDLKKLRPVDRYEMEMEVMAEIRAYFQIAYKVSDPTLRPELPVPPMLNLH